jgi:hypothetical protein
MKASMSASDADRLFEIREVNERGALRVHTRDEVPEAYALARGDWQPPAPLRYKRDEGGSKQGDMIGTTHGLVRLVSGRLVQTMQEHRFSGWTTFPVEVTGKRGEPLDYQGWAVTGRQGDGSDVFLLEGTAVVVVTEDVRRALQDAGVQGVRFERLSDRMRRID